MGMIKNFGRGMLSARSDFLVMVMILVGALAVPDGVSAKSARNLIRELAAEHSVRLNDDEIAVLRRALPIVGRRYLREVDPTPCENMIAPGPMRGERQKKAPKMIKPGGQLGPFAGCP